MEYHLDASDMEPPEPLVRSLELLEDLKPGDYLRFCNWREPVLLYDNLNQSGFSFISCSGKNIEYEVFIWRSADATAESTIQNKIQQDNLEIQSSKIDNAE